MKANVNAQNLCKGFCKSASGATVTVCATLK